MVTEATNDQETLYGCPVDGCGRRLVINWVRPELTVLDKGDFWARHVGGTGGLQMHVAGVSPGPRP
jgi:hypothetical protein